MKSDIDEHLPVLMHMSRNCESVIELGVRDAVSTWAFIEGLRKNTKSPNKKTLISIDIEDVRDISFVKKQAKKAGINFKFVKGDTTKIEIPETDIIFIDTWHIYAQLKRELDLHAEKAKKFIIMHDTESFRHKSEAVVYQKDSLQELSEKTGFSIEDLSKGLQPAIAEFLEEHPEWIVGGHFRNCNGLTILERKGLYEEMFANKDHA
jgi:hypothetical protein